VTDELALPLERICPITFSAISALASDSSRSCCILRYLAKFTAAISSYTDNEKNKTEKIIWGLVASNDFMTMKLYQACDLIGHINVITTSTKGES